MGCGLRKMKLSSEESSPGKIYSTLKRPQVETKVGVAYNYRYLDFLIGKDGGTSTLRLASLRELPAQLQELYQQGFVLATVHPFIHPCGPESSSLQHRLYRAILLRLADRPERGQPGPPPCRLQLEDCLSAQMVPTPELIQGYVKKQVQDAADQGVLFVGFVQEPYGTPGARIREPDTPSESLHSSPTSVLCTLSLGSPPSPPSPVKQPEAEEEQPVDTCEAGEKPPAGNVGNRPGSGLGGSLGGVSPASDEQNEEEEEEEEEEGRRRQTADGAELLALYNHPPGRAGPVKYYTVKVPLQVQNCNNGVKGVEANWLDHMTQHFNNGASLVDGFFHLGSVSGSIPKSVDSVFVFQERSDGEPTVVPPTYDAIVVEQWTVIHDLQVKADYVPLLQSLATFGWRLTCVLPTPVIRTNSDGSVSTKQIVFLQRPVLDRKRRDSKKLIFKARNKSNKTCNTQAAKNKKKKTKKDNQEECPTVSGRGTLTGAEDRNQHATNAAAGESGRSLGHEEGEEDLRPQTGGGEEEAGNVPDAGGGETTRLGGDTAAEPLASAEDTGEVEDQGEAGADGVMENGVEEEEEEEGGGGGRGGGQDEGHVRAEPAGGEVCSKEIRVESSPPNPEEAQESG